MSSDEEKVVEMRVGGRGDSVAKLPNQFARSLARSRRLAGALAKKKAAQYGAGVRIERSVTCASPLLLLLSSVRGVQECLFAEIEVAV